MSKTRHIPPASGPIGPILLSDLTLGAQLPILVALIRANGIPMSNKDLLEETGIRDDERVASALRRLSQRHLVHLTASYANRNEWVATNVARQFFLPAGQDLLDDPEPAQLPPQAAQLPEGYGESGKTGISGKGQISTLSSPESPEKPESPEDASRNLSVDSRDSGKTGIPLPEKESDTLNMNIFNSVLVSHLLNLTETASKAMPKDLEAVYTEALLRGRVFRQIVPPMARALAAEGVQYLPHLLAHIAYSRSPQFVVDGQQRPGAYVKIAVEQRALGDPQFMPPAGLSFQKALAWALLGGHFETDMPDPDAPTPAQAAELDETLLQLIDTARGPMTPVAVWHNMFEQLQLEFNKNIYETWCRPLTVVSYEADTFDVNAPSAYVKDWVEARIASTFIRVLTALLGRPAKMVIRLAPAGQPRRG